MTTEKNVATPHPSILAMESEWDLITHLMGGTPKMKSASKKYLPKWRLENEEDYTSRLGISTLFPAFAETVRNYVSRLFGKPLVIGKDVPSWIVNDVMEDVNFENINYTIFFRQWFRWALPYGMSCVIVDSPEVPANASEADVQKIGARPYWQHVNALQIVGWAADAKGKLIQFRFKISKEVPDGEYNTKMQDVIVVYIERPEGIFVEEHIEVERDGKRVWEMINPARKLGIDVIPLVIYYTQSKGLLRCEPPLRDLAYLNLKHWAAQSSSDCLIQTAQVPILALIGGTSEKEIEIGSKHAVQIPMDGDMKYVEHTGAAINCGRTALDSLKEEMRQAGAKLLPVNNMQAKNELQAGEETNKEASPLASMVQDFTDAIRQVLYLTALWRSQKNGGTVTMQANLEAGVDPIGSMTVLGSMHEQKALSGETYIAEGVRRGLLAVGVNGPDESTKILKEQQAILTQEAKIKMEFTPEPKINPVLP